jgi:hypothetical protein
MHPTNTPNNPEEILEIFGAREHNWKASPVKEHRFNYSTQ